MLSPIIFNSNTIELKVHTSCYWVLDLLCVTLDFAIDVLNLFCPFCFASPEIIGVKIYHRQMDKFSDPILCGFFLSVEFATLVLTSLAGGSFDIWIVWSYLKEKWIESCKLFAIISFIQWGSQYQTCQVTTLRNI